MQTLAEKLGAAFMRPYTPETKKTLEVVESYLRQFENTAIDESLALGAEIAEAEIENDLVRLMIKNLGVR